mmetsp:Transcript_18632/g.43888  ORF Transcript_18632/g.43888 Transcript_18632/m.43888 type:complete len:255 (+) Transcript_18632:975-1739(+)
MQLVLGYVFRRFVLPVGVVQLNQGLQGRSGAPPAVRLLEEIERRPDPSLGVLTLTAELVDLAKQQQRDRLLFHITSCPIGTERAACVLECIVNGVVQDPRAGHGPLRTCHLSLPEFLRKILELCPHLQRHFGISLLNRCGDRKMHTLQFQVLEALLLGLLQRLGERGEGRGGAVLVQEGLGDLEQGDDLLLLAARAHGLGQPVHGLPQSVRGRGALLERARHPPPNREALRASAAGGPPRLQSLRKTGPVHVSA